MLVLRSSATRQVSLNARVVMSRSFELISSSFQKYSWRPCTHSKYETTTPPAFASTSGRIRMPRSSRISSAAGVTGPFAPSAMIFAFTWSAFERVITCSSAHGGHVETVLVVKPAARVGDRDHLRPLLAEKLGKEAADVPESLHGHAQPLH